MRKMFVNIRKGSALLLALLLPASAAYATNNGNDKCEVPSPQQSVVVPIAVGVKNDIGITNKLNNNVDVTNKVCNDIDLSNKQQQDQLQNQKQEQSSFNLNQNNVKVDGSKADASATAKTGDQTAINTVNIAATRAVPTTVISSDRSGPEGAQVYEQRYWGCLTPQEISNILSVTLQLPYANVRDASIKGESGTSIVTISAYSEGKSNGTVPTVREDGLINGTAVGILKVRAMDQKSDEADATFSKDDAAVVAYNKGFRSDLYELVSCQFMSSITNGTTVINQGSGIDIGGSGLLSGVPILGSLSAGIKNGKSTTFTAQKGYARYVIVKKGAGSSIDLNAIFKKICVKEEQPKDVPPPASEKPVKKIAKQEAAKK
ncbi:MAG: hypothetical protein HGA31_05605 [Candidatus Moranbacteria bacterium]|nr:hypothetical protein [Candidatus Moranbacteria bacterium]